MGSRGLAPEPTVDNPRNTSWVAEIPIYSAGAFDANYSAGALDANYPRRERFEVWWSRRERRSRAPP